MTSAFKFRRSGGGTPQPPAVELSRMVQPSRRLVLACALVALAAACCASLSPGLVLAQPLSAKRSATSPYLACPPAAPRHVACDSVIVPPGARLASVSAASVSPTTSGVEGSGYTPAELQSAYKLPSASAGTGQTVAIIDAYGDPTAETDLATYRSSYGLSACMLGNGCFSKVNEIGETTNYPPIANEKEDGDWELETSLDLDMASAICPNCHILLVEANSSSLNNMTASVNEAAALGATEISNSWGSAEFSEEKDFEAAFHHPGIPITAASGDAGYLNNNTGGDTANYPASSPGAIAVGGTILAPAEDSRGWSETTWPASGAGCSLYEPKPWFQTDAGCAKRTTNDVAAVAEGLSVYDTTHATGSEKLPDWIDVGGTSAATPIIAAVEALSSATARSSGAAGFYASPSSLFNVTTGSDGSCGGSYLCTAGTGYSGPTGIGTPDGAFPTASVPPTVTSITPSSGSANGGTTVTIKGTRFASPATVTIGSEASEVDVVSADEIKAKTAATALGADEVVVADANGTSTGGPSYTYVPPPPTVSGIEPSSGPAAGGSEVTITGTGFANGATVHFGTRPASEVTVRSASQITATSPAGSGTVNVTVVMSTGTSEETSADRFSYVPAGQTNGLNISGYCQTLGYEGATLARGAVTGPGYAYENWACEKSGGGLVVIASAGPAPSMDNACQVENPGVSVYAYATEEDNAYTWGCYLVLPNVTSVEPSAGPTAGGTKVRIRGSGFLAGATVKIGSSATSVEVVSETEIKAKTAANAAGPQEVKVSEVNGSSSLGPTYTYASATETTFAGALTHYESPEVKFSAPNAVAVDPSGDIWVADAGHNHIVEFNSSRQLLRQFGEAGSGEGQFHDIGGIAANASGDVYVSDSGNARIQEFSPSGEHMRTFGSSSLIGGQLFTPGAIAIDSEGNVWVLNTYGGPSGGRIVEFSAGGSVISKFGSTGAGEGGLGVITGLAITGGHLYVVDNSNQRVSEFSTKGEYVADFDLAGSGTGKSNEPSGIGANPTSGNLYVTEIGNNRVQEFSAARAYITSFGSAGSGSGQLEGPKGVAIAASGTIFVTDTGNNRMEQWAPGEPPGYTTAVTHYETPEIDFKEPDAVAVDPSSNVWVADSGHDRVVEFNSERRYLRQFGEAGSGQGGFEGVGGITSNSSGDVYVSDSGNARIEEFGPSGEFIRTFGSSSLIGGQLFSPGALAIDSEGNVWVLNTYGGPSGGRIVEFSASGSVLSKFGTTGTSEGELGIITGLAITGGHLYVSEYSNQRVQEFSSKGAYMAHFDPAGSGTGKSNEPWGIAANPTSGNLYVTEIGNDRVQEFSSAGAFVATFGSAGSGSGQFSSPEGVAVGSPGMIYIADSANNRLQEWVP